MTLTDEMAGREHVAARRVNRHDLVVRITLGLMVMVGLSACQKTVRDSWSGNAISRVELTGDGEFLALHQQVLVERLVDPQLERLEPTDLLVDLPEGKHNAVYSSDDGRNWTLSDVEPEEVAWSQTLAGCVGSTCIEFDGSRSTGWLRDPDSEQALFAPYEQPPSCFDGPDFFGSSQCSEVALVGPFDVAVSEPGIMVVALGTEGIALYDDGDWRQVTVDTPRPRSWRRRNLVGLIVAWTVGLLTLLAGATFFFRYRPNDR